MIDALFGADHKVTGLRMAASALAFFLAGGVLALLMRSELAEPGLQIVSHQGYDELFTMHGATMIFLVVIPVALAFCVYFVPLQLGASDLSGARWAALASWLIPLGGLVMWLGFLTREGAGSAGWYAFDPLSDTPHTPGVGMDLWIWGVLLSTAGALVLGWCLLITILRRRAPGMTMLRMPVFTWTAFATALLIVVSFPSLVVGMSLLWLDRRGVMDLRPITYQNLFWFYGHPAVYVMFFPFFGMAAEAASTFSGRRFFGYRAFVPALLGFTVLSLSAWAHHMYTTGAVPVEVFALTSTALIIPAGIEYFDIIATLWRGAIRLTTSMLFVLGFLVQFLIGGLSGIFVASPTLDYHATDTYIVVAHFHYTLMAGSVFALFAGVYLWWPKLTGRRLGEGLGRAHFALMAIGTNLTFLPQFALGYDGMARRLPDYPADTGWQGLNVASTVGSFLIALSVVVFLLAVAGSFLRRRDAAPDPWGTGCSLEWATPSPPPRGNFVEPLPPVRTYAPLLDLREEREREQEDEAVAVPA